MKDLLVFSEILRCKKFVTFPSQHCYSNLYIELRVISFYWKVSKLSNNTSKSSLINSSMYNGLVCHMYPCDMGAILYWKDFIPSWALVSCAKHHTKRYSRRPVNISYPLSAIFQQTDRQTDILICRYAPYYLRGI